MAESLNTDEASIIIREHEEIVKAIAAGDRVKATSLYLSATEGVI